MADANATTPNFDISAQNAQSERRIAGNYAQMAADTTVAQHMADPTSAEQTRWLRLVERQLALIPGRACREFLDAVLGNPALDMRRGIPEFAQVNAARSCDQLATGGRAACCPTTSSSYPSGQSPLSGHRLAARGKAEFDYIVEARSVFDFFGHVPDAGSRRSTLITSRNLRPRRPQSQNLGGLDWLARLCLVHH